MNRRIVVLTLLLLFAISAVGQAGPAVGPFPTVIPAGHQLKLVVSWHNRHDEPVRLDRADIAVSATPGCLDFSSWSQRWIGLGESRRPLVRLGAVDATFSWLLDGITLHPGQEAHLELTLRTTGPGEVAVSAAASSYDPSGRLVRDAWTQATTVMGLDGLGPESPPAPPEIACWELVAATKVEAEVVTGAAWWNDALIIGLYGPSGGRLIRYDGRFSEPLPPLTGKMRPVVKGEQLYLLGEDTRKLVDGQWRPSGTDVPSPDYQVSSGGVYRIEDGRLYKDGLPLVIPGLVGDVVQLATDVRQVGVWELPGDGSRAWVSDGSSWQLVWASTGDGALVPGGGRWYLVAREGSQLSVWTRTASTTVALAIGQDVLFRGIVSSRMNAAPRLLDGTTWVPVHPVVAAMGGTIAEQAGRLACRLGDKTVLVGEEVLLRVIDGVGFAPVRRLAESLGAAVTWIPSGRRITIRL